MCIRDRGYTHLQPAQLTTVGKRACLWMQDLTMDLEEIDFTLSTLKLLGNRGATGTQVSFMEPVSYTHLSNSCFR